MTAERERIEQMKLSLYPDWKAGDISREEYHRLKEQFEQQQARLDTRLASLQTRIDEAQNGVDETNSFLSQFVKYRNLQTLTREVIVELIDMIYVHEGGKITIKFKFSDAYAAVQDYIRKHGTDRIVLKIPSSPAAADTLSALLEDLGAQPRDFDCIVTGDLGHIGADLLLTLLRGDSIDLSPVYSDCGSLIFGDEQDAHAGGSGCGCSAAVLCGPLLRDMHRGKIHRLVFAGTGAMMSPTSVQQGQPIAGICHAVVLERSEA